MHPHMLRHALAPALLMGLLGTTTLAVAPGASAAIDVPIAGGSTPGSVSAPPPQRVIPGVRLRVKAPTSVLPVQGYRLTGRFGAASSLWSSAHTGLDFAAPDGTEIRSIAAGVVVETGYDGSYGNKTTVRLVDGTVLWYCHQSDTAVSEGQRVAAGQLIGYVGSTGNVTGPHLHLEVRPGDDEPIDPEGWLATRGVGA